MSDLNEAIRLSGLNGIWRSDGENTYNAANDFEALRAWVEVVSQQGLPQRTIAQYTLEVERFMLWAVLERKVPMSSITNDDFDQFTRFLADPPAHWKSTAPVKHLSVPWHPMKKPLQPGSIKVAVSVLRRLYKDWRNANYLRLNPLHDYEYKVETASIHWLTSSDWRLIEARLKNFAHDAFARRTRAALYLMRRCCIRQQDVVALQYGSLVRYGSSAPGFAIADPGGTLRIVDHETWSSIEAHYSDRVQLIAQTSLGRFEPVPDAAQPLIGALELAGIREVAHSQPVFAGQFASKANPMGGIRQPVIARCAMSFFEDLSRQLPNDEKAQAFLHRSRTWLSDPSRQTPERRKQIIIDKVLGNPTHEFVDDEELEKQEVFKMFANRPESFRF